MPSVVLVSGPAPTTEFGETNHLISLHCAKKNMCISDRIWQCNANLCPKKKLAPLNTPSAVSIAWNMASCFGSSGHDIVLIIPSTHALEHLIEATLGSFVTTTTDLNDRKGWERMGMAGMAMAKTKNKKTKGGKETTCTSLQMCTLTMLD